jgi:hypothetical protein
MVFIIEDDMLYHHIVDEMRDFGGLGENNDVLMP